MIEISVEEIFLERLEISGQTAGSWNRSYENESMTGG